MMVDCILFKVKPSGSCDELYEQGVTQDGVYTLKIEGKEYESYCQFKSNQSEHNWLVSFCSSAIIN